MSGRGLFRATSQRLDATLLTCKMLPADEVPVSIRWTLANPDQVLREVVDTHAKECREECAPRGHSPYCQVRKEAIDVLAEVHANLAQPRDKALAAFTDHLLDRCRALLTESATASRKVPDPPAAARWTGGAVLGQVGKSLASATAAAMWIAVLWVVLVYGLPGLFAFMDDALSMMMVVQ